MRFKGCNLWGGLGMKYNDFKAILSALSAHAIRTKEDSHHVKLAVYDGNHKYRTVVRKIADDGTTEHPDYTDYKATVEPTVNTQTSPVDNEVRAQSVTMKNAPDGWHQQLYEYEIRTASTFKEEKDFDGTDQGFITHEFYAGGVSQGANPDNTTDTTIIRWMPTYGYYIMTGGVKTREELATDVRLNVRALERTNPLAGLGHYNFTQGNVNLRYHPRQLVGLESANGRLMPYTVHPQLGQLYTNELSFKFTHPAGEQHDIAVILNIFVEPGN